MSALDRLKKFKQTQESKKATFKKTAKIPDGRSVLRILPGGEKDRGLFFQPFANHFIKDNKGQLKAVYVCSEETFDKPCEICEMINDGKREIRSRLGKDAAEHDPTFKMLDEARAKGRVLVNAINVTAGETEPQIYEFPKSLFEKDLMDVLEEMALEGDDFEENMGIDVVVKRSGSGRDTRYTLSLAKKQSETSPAMLEKMEDLYGYAQQESEAKKAKAITALASSTHGKLPAPAEKATESIASDLASASVDDAIDVEYEVKAAAGSDVSPSPTTTSASSDEDDLNDLLAELG